MPTECAWCPRCKRFCGRCKTLVNLLPRSATRLGSWSRPAWCAGRTLTSYHTTQDDVRNAGGTWVDQEVVEDGNWVTSRQPSDIPAFNRSMIVLFSRARARAQQTA